MGLQVTVDASQLDELHERLHADPKTLMAQLADAFAASLRQKLAAANPAPSAATLEIRRRRGRGGTAALVDTGDMAGSIKARSTRTVAAARVSWPAHALNRGFTTAGDSAIPGKAVPARNFVFLDDAEIADATDKLEAFFLG